MKTRIGILIELENGRIKPANMGVITLARSDSTKLYAIVPQEPDNQTTKDLETFGVEHIIYAPLSLNDCHNPMMVSQIVLNILDTHKIHTLFGLSTSYGKNILPRIAARLDAPLIMDCVDVDLNAWTAKTSQYSGKTIATYKIDGPEKIFGIRSNTIEAQEFPVSATIYDEAISRPESTSLKVIKIGEQALDGKLPIADAEVIISGGRGVKNADNFSILFECADKLKAAVGSSRVPVDFGWVPYAMQVGITGEKVSPQVYIACGISGSVQHFAGMKTSGMVIAVNTDENAAMVANSDYFAIADAIEVITEINNILDND